MAVAVSQGIWSVDRVDVAVSQGILRRCVIQNKIAKTSLCSDRQKKKEVSNPTKYRKHGVVEYCICGLVVLMSQMRIGGFILAVFRGMWGVH